MDLHGSKLLKIHVFNAQKVEKLNNILLNNLKVIKQTKITKILKIKQLKVVVSIFKNT